MGLYVRIGFYKCKNGGYLIACTFTEDKPTVFGNPRLSVGAADKRTDQQRCVKARIGQPSFFKAWNITMIFDLFDIS